MKASIRPNNMNFGEKWLRLTSEGTGEENYGNCIDSAEAMTIDSMVPTKSGLTIFGSNEGGVNAGITLLNKASNDLVAAQSQQKNKGIYVSSDGLTKEDEEDVDMGLVVLDAKRRRSDLGLEDKVGSSNSTTTMMEVVLVPKNGLAVGPVDQAHQTQ